MQIIIHNLKLIFSKGARICDTEKCKSLTSKVKTNAVKSLELLQNMANQAQPNNAPPSVTQMVTVASANVAGTSSNPAMTPASPTGAGDKAGTSEKSKDASSLVLEEIKKIQKATDRHRVGGGGAQSSFR